MVPNLIIRRDGSWLWRGLKHQIRTLCRATAHREGRLSGVIDEGGDGFEPQGAQAALMAGLEPAGDRLRCPSFGEAITDEVPQPAIPFEDGVTVCAVDRLRRRGAAKSGPWARRFGATPATRWIWPAPPPWRWRRSNGQPPSVQLCDLFLHPADANSLACQPPRRS